MEQSFLDYAVAFRIFAFTILLIVFAAAERLAPRRKKTIYTSRRWISNLAIVAINSFLVRLIFPLMAVEIAFVASENGWGLFHYLDFSWWLNFFLGIVILDLVIYFQHVLFHSVPVLWRLHKVHHTDLDFDVTTGVRFHPIEITLSMGIKILTVAAFGINPFSVLIFEVILNGTSMFTHTNIYLPLGLDSLIRWLFVTPDMHRIHHSKEWDETHTNFGFNFSIWDRIFGTYRQNPKKDHKDMPLGVQEFRDPKYLKLRWLFLIPFLKDTRR